jgi:hypothetical protein
MGENLYFPSSTVSSWHPIFIRDARSAEERDGTELQIQK